VRTLTRYLVARFFQFFAVVVVSTVLAIVVVELLLNLDRMLAFRGGPRGILEYLGLRLVGEYASYVVPIAAFLAAFLTVALSAYTREWLAVKAGGVSLLRFAAPLLLCGVALSALAPVFHESAVISARQAWNRGTGGDDPIRFRSGSFWYQRGARIYNVGLADRARRRLEDVEVFERDPSGLLRRSIRARNVELLDGLRWRFRDGLVREFDPDEPASIPRVARFTERVIEMADPPDAALLAADPAALRIPRLRELIRARLERGDRALEQRRILAERVGDWTSIALLVAVAIPLGLGVERTRNLGQSAVFAVAALVGYYAVRNVAAILAAQGALAPTAAYAGLAALLFAAAAVGLARTPR